MSLYREQRTALARKDKERKEELSRLSVQRNEVQDRVDELELLLKSTVQNIRPNIENSASAAPSEAGAELAPEASDPLPPSQSENIDKILTLLDEIRDPYQGHSIPAMIGVEYYGPMYVI